jgi:hypothetical protein
MIMQNINANEYDEWCCGVANLAIAQTNKMTELSRKDENGKPCADPVKVKANQEAVNASFDALLNTTLTVSGTKKTPTSKGSSQVNTNTLLVRVAQHCGLTGGLIDTYLGDGRGIKGVAYIHATALLSLNLCAELLQHNDLALSHENLVNMSSALLLDAVQDFDPAFNDVVETTEASPFAPPVVAQPVATAIPQAITTVETTVDDGGFVSLSAIKARIGNLQDQQETLALALELFKGDENMKDGQYMVKKDGKPTRGQQYPFNVGGWKTEQRYFEGRILNALGFNLCGVWSQRGVGKATQYANRNCISSVNADGIDDGRVGNNATLQVITAAVIVEANVTKFNHDLRKYVSPSDCDKIAQACNILSDDELDQKVDGTNASTWLLKDYEPNGYSSNRPSENEIADIVSSSLASLL